MGTSILLVTISTNFLGILRFAEDIENRSLDSALGGQSLFIFLRVALFVEGLLVVLTFAFGFLVFVQSILVLVSNYGGSLGRSIGRLSFFGGRSFLGYALVSTRFAQHHE